MGTRRLLLLVALAACAACQGEDVNIINAIPDIREGATQGVDVVGYAPPAATWTVAAAGTTYTPLYTVPSSGPPATEASFEVPRGWVLHVHAFNPFITRAGAGGAMPNLSNDAVELPGPCLPDGMDVRWSLLVNGKPLMPFVGVSTLRPFATISPVVLGQVDGGATTKVTLAITVSTAPTTPAMFDRLGVRVVGVMRLKQP